MSVNAYANDLPADLWEQALKDIPSTGGFFLGRALEVIAARNCLDGVRELPIPIVVSDHPEASVSTSNAVELLAAAHLPTTWFHLYANGELYAHDANEDPSHVSEGTLTDLLNRSWLAWPNPTDIQELLPNTNEPDLVINPKAKGPEMADAQAGSWEAGSQLKQAEFRLALHPNEELETPHALVHRSFAAHALSRATAFLCLESEAQEQALFKKQNELLNASSLFDAGDELKPMSEPVEWIALGMLALVLFWRRRFAG
jgi:hypothetical protein